MFSDSFLYKKVVSPDKSDWLDQNGEIMVYFSLNAIVDVFNIEVANSILLGLLREYESKQISLRYLLKALNTIEKYHFINNAISSNRSSGLDTMYAKFSRNIMEASTKHNKHTEIDRMITKLSERVPAETEYLANFDEKVYYTKKDTKQKKLVQYVLRKIEMKAQNDNIDLLSMSIEHVYPETPNENWNNINDEDLIKNIGNLVFLDSGLNSLIGNKNYEKKKEIIIEKSTLISTKEVFNKNEVWSEASIKLRRDEIAGLMYDGIW